MNDLSILEEFQTLEHIWNELSSTHFLCKVFQPRKEFSPVAAWHYDVQVLTIIEEVEWHDDVCLTHRLSCRMSDTVTAHGIVVVPEKKHCGNFGPSI